MKKKKKTLDLGYTRNTRNTISCFLRCWL